MSEGTPVFRVISPLQRPARQATTKAMKKDATLATWLEKKTKNSALIPYTEPTERSISPEMRINAIPMATIPSSAACARSAAALPAVANWPSVRIVNATQTTTKLANTPNSEILLSDLRGFARVLVRVSVRGLVDRMLSLFFCPARNREQ